MLLVIIFCVCEVIYLKGNWKRVPVYN